MSDQGVFLDPDDKDKDQRESKINNAFGSLSPAKPLSSAEQERVQSLREAVAAGDRAKVEEHLDSTKKESNWLYEELTKHPDIAAILNELSIMGF